MEQDAELLRQAAELHQQGQLDDAQELYLSWLQSHPDDVEALDLLAILYAQRGQYQLAREQLNTALSLQPSNPQLLNHMGQIHRHLGMPENAEKLLTQALQLQPDYPEATINLGQLLESKGDWSNARLFYQAALARNPQDYAISHCLALNYLNTQHVVAARDLWQNIIEKFPNHFPSQFFLGTITYELGEYDNAKQYFQAALAINPDHVDSLSNLGAVYLKLNDSVHALELFEKAVALQPGNLFAHTNLAATLLTAGKIDGAIKQYFELLTAVPNDFTAHYNLGTIFMEQRKWESAHYHLQTAVETDPESFAAVSNLANVLLKRREKAAAIRCYQIALSLKPDDEQVQYILQSLTGEGSPVAAPHAYVTALFDNYANYFESDVLDKLQYRVPELLEKAVHDWLLDREDLTILDLGCGTGLCGQALSSYAKKLIGIDISKNMLEKAKEKSCYAELIQADLVDGMQQLNESVEMIICADTLVYVGDLLEVFKAASAVLVKTGIFAFSVERNEEKTDYQLQQSGRFAHSVDYIEKLANEFNFTVLNKQYVELRSQAGEPVKGLIFVLENLRLA